MKWDKQKLYILLQLLTLMFSLLLLHSQLVSLSLFSFIMSFGVPRMVKLLKKNPWKSTSLEWQTPEQPPIHGNFGKELPVVYRWAYDYSVPGAEDDFIPQDVPNEKVKLAEGYTELGVEKT